MSLIMATVPGSGCHVTSSNPQDAMQEWVDVYGDSEAEELKFYSIELLELRVDVTTRIVPIK